MKYKNFILFFKQIWLTELTSSNWNTAIFGVVSLLLCLLVLMARVGKGEDLADNKPSSSQTDNSCDCGFKRVSEIGGMVLVDGSLRVVEANYTKTFDLVQVSTPVAPATGHARIWLEPTDGDLKIQFANGTIRTLALN